MADQEQDYDVIVIPGVGEVNFPKSMGEAAQTAAAKKLHDDFVATRNANIAKQAGAGQQESLWESLKKGALESGPVQGTKEAIGGDIEAAKSVAAGDWRGVLRGTHHVVSGAMEATKWGAIPAAVVASAPAAGLTAIGATGVTASAFVPLVLGAIEAKLGSEAAGWAAEKLGAGQEIQDIARDLGMVVGPNFGSEFGPEVGKMLEARGARLQAKASPKGGGGSAWRSSTLKGAVLEPVASAAGLPHGTAAAVGATIDAVQSPAVNTAVGKVLQQHAPPALRMFTKAPAPPAVPPPLGPVPEAPSTGAEGPWKGGTGAPKAPGVEPPAPGMKALTVKEVAQYTKEGHHPATIRALDEQKALGNSGTPVDKAPVLKGPASPPVSPAARPAGVPFRTPPPEAPAAGLAQPVESVGAPSPVEPLPGPPALTAAQRAQLQAVADAGQARVQAAAPGAEGLRRPQPGTPLPPEQQGKLPLGFGEEPPVEAPPAEVAPEAVTEAPPPVEEAPVTAPVPGAPAEGPPMGLHGPIETEEVTAPPAPRPKKGPAVRIPKQQIEERAALDEAVQQYKAAYPDMEEADIRKGLTGMMDHVRSEAAQAAETDGQALLKEIAKGGGISIKNETGLKGEVAWLKELRTQIKSLRTGRDITAADIKGVRGVFHDRDGLSMDGMLEYLTRNGDPRWEGLKTINDLTEAITKAGTTDPTRSTAHIDAFRQMVQNELPAPPPSEPPVVDTLDTGEGQPRLPGEVGDVRSAPDRPQPTEPPPPLILQGGTGAPPKEVQNSFADALRAQETGEAPVAAPPAEPAPAPKPAEPAEPAPLRRKKAAPGESSAPPPTELSPHPAVSRRPKGGEWETNFTEKNGLYFNAAGEQLHPIEALVESNKGYMKRGVESRAALPEGVKGHRFTKADIDAAGMDPDVFLSHVTKAEAERLIAARAGRNKFKHRNAISDKEARLAAENDE